MRTRDCRNAAAVLLLVVVAGMVSISGAYEFFVGGRDGWVPDPSEAYNHWAERNRFLVDDRLSMFYSISLFSKLSKYRKYRPKLILNYQCFL